MKLSSVSSKSSSSTTVGSEFAQSLLDRDIKDWRTEYRDIYRELTVAELRPGGVELMKRGLALLGDSVVDSSGRGSRDAVANGWTESADDIVTVVWRGSGTAVRLQDLSRDAENWVKHQWAEPGALNAFTYGGRALNDARLLVALAAGAECAPTKQWLAAGGSVVAVMRPNPERWRKLMEAASEGSLLVIPIRRTALGSQSLPESLDEIAAIAGVDLVNEAASVAGWLHRELDQLSWTNGILAAGFGYSPGASHVTLQVVQDALMVQVASAYPDVAMTWLGTPTDSLMTPQAHFEARLARFEARTVRTKVRDAMFSAAGLGKLSSPPLLDLHEICGQQYVRVDCSADMQGPNYLLAKRSQRWRAMVAAAEGTPVAYCVSPAARTHSVLDHKILRATYRGAPGFGVRPFEVEETQQLTAQLMLSLVNQPVSAAEPSALYLERAIHGGLWTSVYNPQQIWKAATISGWPALLKSSF